MNDNEKVAWGVAIFGWVIGLFRYIFSAGALAARIEGVEKKVDGLGVGHTTMLTDIGEIKGELKRMNGRR